MKEIQQFVEWLFLQAKWIAEKIIDFATKNN